MNEIGPFQMWRAIVALALTALVCIATYLIMSYLMVAGKPPGQQKAATGSSVCGTEVAKNAEIAKARGCALQ